MGHSTDSSSRRGSGIVRLRTALQITSAIIVAKAVLIGLVVYERAAILGYCIR